MNTVKKVPIKTPAQYQREYRQRLKNKKNKSSTEEKSMKTNAQRQKMYRQRIKNTNNKTLEKEALRMKEYRHRLKFSQMSEGIRTTAVFSMREKLLLAQLVKENPIIENKKTDNATSIEKNRAWESLTAIYNAQPEVYTIRTSQQLRKLWNNLKQRKRKETIALRHGMLTTGGPLKLQKPDPVLKFVSEVTASSDDSVNSPWDSTHLFERAGTSSTVLELMDTAMSQDAKKATVQVLCNSPMEPVPSTAQFFYNSSREPEPVPSNSKGTVEFFFLDNSSSKEPASPSYAESVVAKETADSELSPTGVVTEKDRVLPEEKLGCNTLVEATHQQKEIFKLKKQIGEEELLRVKKERIRAAQQNEITALDLQRAKLELQRAVLDHQRAADEAELASLKLKHFKKEVI